MFCTIILGSGGPPQNRRAGVRCGVLFLACALIFLFTGIRHLCGGGFCCSLGATCFIFTQTMHAVFSFFMLGPCGAGFPFSPLVHRNTHALFCMCLRSVLRRALDIAGKVYGPEHADVATYLNNLARVLKAQVRRSVCVSVCRACLSGPRGCLTGSLRSFVYRVLIVGLGVFVVRFGSRGGRFPITTMNQPGGESVERGGCFFYQFFSIVRFSRDHLASCLACLAASCRFRYFTHAGVVHAATRFLHAAAAAKSSQQGSSNTHTHTNLAAMICFSIFFRNKTNIRSKN